MASLENVKPRDLFGAVDLDGSGYIDREELAAVCDLDAHDLAEVFDKLDADKDGRISIEEFSENFRKFKSVVSGVKRKKSEQSTSSELEFEDLKEKLGQSFSLLSGQEYVSELFHYLHTSADSPQLLALLESFLFSVVRDVKHYSSENQRLEDALKRTCEKHTEHMDQLDNELEQQMQRLESRIRKEERSKQERSNLDIVWQMENKNKEIQTLNARVQKLEGRLKRKEPEEQKIKEEVDEKVQEIRFLRSQLTDAQTNLAVLRSELAQLRNDYEEQESQLTAEKRTVMECVQEQESLTRQLQLLHEANKKLHDTNDDLRAALEVRKGEKRSPSPSKRHSITTLYSPTSSLQWNARSPANRCSSGLGEDFATADSVDGRSPQTTSPRNISVPVLPLSTSNSRRGSLLPSQQSCEMDDESIMNENSLMTELIQVQQLSVPADKAEEEGEKDLDYNNNAGILNSREAGQIHHLIPPSRQSCEVDDPVSAEDKCFFDEPVILGYCTMGKSRKTTDPASLTSDDTEQSDKDTDKLLRNRNSSRFSSRFGKYFGKLAKGSKSREESKANEERKDSAMKKREVPGNPGLRKSGTRNTAVKKGEMALKKNDSKDAVLKRNESKKGKHHARKRDFDNSMNGKLQNSAQDKAHAGKESKRGRNVDATHEKLRISTFDLDYDSEAREQQFTREDRNRRTLSNVGTHKTVRKNSSVTFSPTVTCNTDNTRGGPAQKTKSITNKRLSTPVQQKQRHVIASETSDTDSTTQEIHANFHRELAEEDEAYNTMRPSERQTFTKQLDILQETNKRLCDSNDDLRAALEALTGRRSLPFKSRARKSGEKCHRNPSVHSDYGSISSRSITPNHLQGPKSEDDIGDGAEAEADEADELSGYDPESDGNTMTTDSLPESDSSKPDAQLSAELEAQFKSVIEEDDEDIDEDDVGDEELAQLVAMATALTESEDSDTETEAPEGERCPAVGSDSTSEASTNTPLHASAAENTVPERMYKLVLAGDAAVGKSSFILRLCRNKFHNALNSTLGVDFQMKTLCVDGKTIALQLWDTAGQERFRSIAKSYFRKADGVLLLYDVTCETSYLNVRDWVEAIEESTPKPIPIMLCGNKIDLRQSYVDEGKTIITEENGEKLAKEYGALFLETSSKENKNITEACIELGRLLRKIEDTEVEESNGLRLTEGDHKNKKKANCCPT